MKYFMFSLALIAFVAIQDATARPRGRQNNGEESRDNRRLGMGRGRLPQGFGGKGGFGQQENGPMGENTGRRPFGRPGRRPRHHRPKPCLLVNTTSSELLCNNTCPMYKQCVKYEKQFSELPGLEIHVCMFKECDPANSASCPEPLSCTALRNPKHTVTHQCRLPRSERPGREGRRPFESSEENEDEFDVEDEFEDEEESIEDIFGEESVESDKRCKEVMRYIFEEAGLERPSRPRPRPPMGGMRPPFDGRRQNGGRRQGSEGRGGRLQNGGQDTAGDD